MRRFVEDLIECPEQRAARGTSGIGDLINAEGTFQVLKNVGTSERDDARVTPRVDTACQTSGLASDMSDEGVEETISEDFDSGFVRLPARMKRLVLFFESGNGSIGQAACMDAGAAQGTEVHNQTTILGQCLKAIE